MSVSEIEDLSAESKKAFNTGSIVSTLAPQFSSNVVQIAGSAANV
jgi:hypothetical protein